jgi:transcriptional regulator with XRE-family HTH domain
MDKAIHTDEQGRLCRLLREYRERAGLRQVDVAERVGEPQSFVSKYESGERRLDLIELRQVCVALGIGLVDFVSAFEQAR